MQLLSVLVSTPPAWSDELTIPYLSAFGNQVPFIHTGSVAKFQHRGEEKRGFVGETLFTSQNMNRTHALARCLGSSLRCRPLRSSLHSVSKPLSTSSSTPRIINRLYSSTTTQQYQQTTNKMAANAQTLIDLAKQRRSFYPLSKDLTISTSRIEEIVKDLLDQVPSSFNSQSNRVVVLFGTEHEKLWDIAAEILKPIVPAEQWESTSGKMSMFKAAAGTVRFPSRLLRTTCSRPFADPCLVAAP